MCSQLATSSSMGQRYLLFDGPGCEAAWLGCRPRFVGVAVGSTPVVVDEVLALSVAVGRPSWGVADCEGDGVLPGAPA
jgi:hypothetical protein